MMPFKGTMGDSVNSQQLIADIGVSHSAEMEEGSYASNAVSAIFSQLC